MLKKIGIAIAIIVLIIIGLAGIFFLRYQAMANNITSQYQALKPLDLTRVADGVYTGSFGDFLVFAKVQVTVKDHRLARLEIKEQRAGQGYEALEIVDRILKAQSLNVDSITGATGSSKCVVLAVARALQTARP